MAKINLKEGLQVHEEVNHTLTLSLKDENNKI